MNHIIQFPRIMLVKFGFKANFYTLVNEEERVIFYFG